MPHVVVAAGAALETAFLPQRLWALRADHRVRVTVALSREALSLVTEPALRAITGEPVYVENVSWDERDRPRHLALREADLLLVAPATGRLLADLATGRIVDAPTRLFAFTPKERVVIAPAVHPHFDPRLYAPHVETLRGLGCAVLGDASMHATWAEARAAVVDRLALERRVRPRGAPILLEDLD